MNHNTIYEYCMYFYNITREYQYKNIALNPHTFQLGTWAALGFSLCKAREGRKKEKSVFKALPSMLAEATIYLYNKLGLQSHTRF